MNNTNTGKSIAAPTDPNDTILLSAISTSANTKHINPICQFVIKSTPKDVATPFPPLNPKNIGNVCPKTTAIPASCTNKALSVFFAIFPTIIANNIATADFMLHSTLMNEQYSHQIENFKNTVDVRVKEMQ